MSSRIIYSAVVSRARPFFPGAGPGGVGVAGSAAGTKGLVSLGAGRAIACYNATWTAILGRVKR